MLELLSAIHTRFNMQEYRPNIHFINLQYLIPRNQWSIIPAISTCRIFSCQHNCSSYSISRNIWSSLRTLLFTIFLPGMHFLTSRTNYRVRNSLCYTRNTRLPCISRKKHNKKGNKRQLKCLTVR